MNNPFCFVGEIENKKKVNEAKRMEEKNTHFLRVSGQREGGSLFPHVPLNKKTRRELWC
jgi:hypothetical protein